MQTVIPIDYNDSGKSRQASDFNHHGILTQHTALLFVSGWEAGEQLLCTSRPVKIQPHDYTQHERPDNENMTTSWID